TIVSSSGTYRIDVVDLPDSIVCINLYDTYLDVTTNLISNSSYVFNLDATDVAARFEINFCTSVSTIIERDKAVFETFNIYPNPTNGRFVVELNSLAQQELSIQVVNNVGQLVIKSKLNAKKGIQTAEINLNDCSAGMYFVQITNEKGYTVSKRVIKIDR
ncbi:MAG: T9SS type A sorting domain-containing protein, partial [Flavobacteriales bacterium]|nr:T9SS type A sorting domain-containing protein [Flavobacteriales bacterium]